MAHRIRMMHTGGTLGMVGGEPGPFHPGGDPVGSLIRKIPELNDLGEIRVEVLAQQDSCDVTANQWLEWAKRLREDDWADGFVLIHGTDTMVYTASVLSFLLEERCRPIVLTGSQRPLSAVRNDARQNLVDAVTLATHEVNEVMICFDSLGIRGNRALKMSSTAMAAFASPNFRALVTLGVDLVWNEQYIRQGGQQRRLQLGDQVRVSWVMPDMPISGTWRPEGLGVHVIAGLGAGNVPMPTGWLARIERETRAGVIHLMVSQCPHGGARAGMYASSEALQQLGVLSGRDMTYVAALMKARVGLGQFSTREELAHYLTTDVAGEIGSIS